jgi:hypothetical protein
LFGVDTKYFYKHKPPLPLAEIVKDIYAIETETRRIAKRNH